MKACSAGWSEGHLLGVWTHGADEIGVNLQGRWPHTVRIGSWWCGGPRLAFGSIKITDGHEAVWRLGMEVQADGWKVG